MKLQWCLKMAQIALLSFVGFYVLVILIDASRAGDDKAIYLAAAVSLIGIAVSAVLTLAFWITNRVRRHLRHCARPSRR